MSNPEAAQAKNEAPQPQALITELASLLRTATPDNLVRAAEIFQTLTELEAQYQLSDIQKARIEQLHSKYEGQVVAQSGSAVTQDADSQQKTDQVLPQPKEVRRDEELENFEATVRALRALVVAENFNPNNPIDFMGQNYQNFTELLQYVYTQRPNREEGALDAVNLELENLARYAADFIAETDLQVMSPEVLDTTAEYLNKRIALLERETPLNTVFIELYKKILRLIEEEGNVMFAELSAGIQMKFTREVIRFAQSPTTDLTTTFSVQSRTMSEDLILEKLVPVLKRQQNQVLNLYPALTRPYNQNLLLQLEQNELLLDALDWFVEIFGAIDVLAADVAAENVNRATFYVRRAQLEQQIAQVGDSGLQNRLTERLNAIQAPEKNKNIDSVQLFLERATEISKALTTIDPRSEKRPYLNELTGEEEAQVSIVVYLTDTLADVQDRLTGGQARQVGLLIERVNARIRELNKQDKDSWEGQVKTLPWWVAAQAEISMALPPVDDRPALEARLLRVQQVLQDYDAGVAAFRRTQQSGATNLQPVEEYIQKTRVQLQEVANATVALLNENTRRTQEEQRKAAEQQVKQQEQTVYDAWTQRVEPLVVTIVNIEQLDKKKVKPVSNDATAKDTAELQVYKDALVTTHQTITAAGDLADSPSQLINKDILNLVGQTKVGGRYADALTKIEEMIVKSKEKLNLRRLDPEEMTLEQIVEAMQGIMTEQSPWANAVKNKFIYRKGEETDPYKFARNHLLASMPSVMLAGDSEKADFAADYNKVIDPLISSGISFENLMVYIFMKPRNPNDIVTSDDILKHNLPIDTRAIDLWKYIVLRIKDKYNGITHPVVVDNGIYNDNTKGLIPKGQGESDAQYQARLKKIYDIEQEQIASRSNKEDRFGYNGLKGEHSIAKFMAELKIIFVEDGGMSDEKAEILINFFKHFGAKSAGYVPWLIEATTRAHGFPASNKGEKSDESRFLNALALNMYNALRYRYLKLGRFMAVFRYVKKERFVGIIKSSSGGKEKGHSAEMAWDVMDAYSKSKWEGNVPQWMVDARNLFEPGPNGEKPDIDIMGTIYPPLPEMLGNIAAVEQEKREILAQYETSPGSGTYDRARKVNGKTFEERVKLFIDKYDKRGYGAKFNMGDSPERKLEMFGTPKITELQTDPTNLTLAEVAVEKMFKFFEEPMPVLHENHETKQHEAIPKFEEWCSSIIGKAKLIPGDHQLLFVPFTCEVIVTLCNRSELAGNKWEVNKLFSELITQLGGAPGIPDYVKNEVFKAFGVKESHGHLKIPYAPRYCINYENKWGKWMYKRKLWLFRNEHTKGFVPALGRLIPFWGAFDSYVAPYEESVKKSKDTTSSGS